MVEHIIHLSGKGTEPNIQLICTKQWRLSQKTSREALIRVMQGIKLHISLHVSSNLREDLYEYCVFRLGTARLYTYRNTTTINAFTFVFTRRQIKLWEKLTKDRDHIQISQLSKHELMQLQNVLYYYKGGDV